MTKEELLAKINYQPRHYEYTEEVNFSSKVTPYKDSGSETGGFCGNCSSNVLGEHNNDAAMAMCKDSS